MFWRKVEKSDVIHQTNVKRGITSHFSRTLKVLQQRHLQADSDEFIYSDDFSNNLCSALEAVFLHGLKDSVGMKMSNYVGLANTQDQALYINFWEICAHFTHKDVITQLRSLAQINTDIGLCRAWIRVALNDGLMESYLHSMIVDQKLMKYYYHSHSFLRDHEQPGILKNFLTGLMSLTFKLSFNSSVLNAWSNSSLQLAGILDFQNVPRSSISSTVSSSPESEGNVIHASQKKEEPIVASKSASSPPKPSMFSSIHDVEQLRKTTAAHSVASSKSVISEGSTSSHASCPDSSGFIIPRNKESWDDAAKMEIDQSPALYPRSNIPAVFDNIGNSNSATIVGSEKLGSDFKFETSVDASHSGEVDRKSNSSVIIDHSPFFELDIAQTPPRARSRRVDIDENVNIASPRNSNVPSTHSSHSHSLSNSPKPSDFALDNVKQTSVSPTEEATLLCDLEDDGIESNVSPAARKMTMARGYEEICATLPPLKLDPVEQDAILKKVLQEIDEQADKDRENREEQRTSLLSNEFYDSHLEDRVEKISTVEDEDTSDKANLEASTNTVVPQHEEDKSEQFVEHVLEISDIYSSKFQSDNEPGNSDTMLQAAEIEQEGSRSVLDNSQTVRPDGLARSIYEREESGLYTGDSESPSSGNFGNSLSGMVGWSSEIETSPSQSKGSPQIRTKTRGESFASMLKAYAGENSLISTTVDQVIQTFYGTDNSPPSPVGISAEDKDTIQRQDSYLDEFEILDTPSPNSFQSIQSVQELDSCRSVFLFRIPREHGLSHQNFTCRGCSRPIGIIYGQPRLCNFDGGLYCFECHENNESYIPSSIVFNWDFGKKEVCVENFKFLQELEDQPLYDIEELNPKLKTHVPVFKNITVLREQLCFLKSYLFNCTQKVAESLRQKVWPREHLYERANLYSMTDLLQVHSGSMVRFIKDLVKFASKHVYECSLCNQKGFVCEICRNPQVIFPFEFDITVRCPTCKSVYHKTCKSEKLPCPKCERWGKRKQESIRLEEDDHPEDYGSSPPLK